MEDLEKELIKKMIKEGSFHENDPLQSLSKIRHKEITDFKAQDLTAYSWFLSYLELWNASERVAFAITDKDERGQSLAVLAQRLAQKNLIADAERIVFSLPSKIKYRGAFIEKLQAIIIIADKVADTGDISKANDYLEDAIKMIDLRNHNDFLQSGLLNEVGEIWIKLKQKNKAVDVLELAKESAEKSILAYKNSGVADVDSWQVLIFIAKNLLTLGEYEKAKDAILIISDVEWRNKQLEKHNLDL